jgi:alkaline phosphatase D
VPGAGSVRNPVVIGGDVHTFYAADIHARPGDPASPVVAPEFIGSSITSLSLPQRQIDAMRATNPHIRLAHGERRGYALVELDRKRFDLRMQMLDDGRRRDSGISTLARYVVEETNPRMLTA